MVMSERAEDPSQVEFDCEPERREALGLDLETPGVRLGVLLELALCVSGAGARGLVRCSLAHVRLALPDAVHSLRIIATRLDAEHCIEAVSAPLAMPSFKLASHLSAA